jgi:CubicO group peptidase (beta-lactamase class C family)
MTAGEGHMERHTAARVVIFTALLALATTVEWIGKVHATSGANDAALRPVTTTASDPFFAQTVNDSACSSAGKRDVVDGALQCICNAGYSGQACESCAVGYERDKTGKCVLGAIARREMCFNKGTPYLNAFGDIACKCDTGYSGPSCGGPALVVDGNLLSLEAGARRRLRVKGGSGSYEWLLPSGRGMLIADGTGGRTYVAPTDVQQVENVRIRVRDLSQQHILHVNITVTPPRALAVTGIPNADLVSFDQAMLDYMKGRGIRAGVLAVAKDGHLVFSRGYGYMDKGADSDPFIHDEGGVGYVGPSTPMRLASITKPITAAAVRKALADEQLSSDLAALPFINTSLGEAINSMAEQWFPYTADTEPYYVESDVNNAYDNCLEFQQGSMPDSRWEDITIEDLLKHEGGFNRDLSPSPRWSGEFTLPGGFADTSYGATSGDPNFKPVLMMHDLEIATGNDYFGPLRPKELVQYMAGFCLASTPGTQRVYSNFGYTLLGRVLEGLHGEQWSAGNGNNRRFGWGPYIDIVETFLAGYGITSGIRAGGTGSFNSENPDGITTEEPYYRHLRADGTEYMYTNVGDAFGIAPNGDMYFPTPTMVPGPYGAFSMQTMESHGGLVATAPALIKFMRHFRLRNSNDYGTIGTPRGSTSIGNASHGGLLPGTYGLAWQLPSGDKTFSVPALIGVWDQISNFGFSILSDTSCTLPTGIDVVALFNQSTDPKDQPDSEYGRLSHFLGRAACQVTNWPNPLGPTTEKAGQ